MGDAERKKVEVEPDLWNDWVMIPRLLQPRIFDVP